MHFSYFTFFSDFVIFQVVKWMFIIFHAFQFSCPIPCPQWTFRYCPPFSVFLAIFHVRKCVFLIFREFQVSRHIPGPSVGISHFSRFLVISSFFKSRSGCLSFSRIFSFLAIFHVLQCAFLIFHVFVLFRHFSSGQVDVSHFP